MSAALSPVRPRGRRPGSSDTREAIAAAARRLFGDRGYAAVSIRSIADEADVDPALVMYFFGSKRELFDSLIQLPFDPSVVPRMLAAGTEGIGHRLATHVLSQLRCAETKDVIIGLLRTASTDPDAAKVLRARYQHDLLEPVAAALPFDRPQLRAALCSSQLMGLTIALKVIELSPLVSAEAELLAEIYGSTLQRYLTGPLPQPPTPEGTTP